MALRRPTEQGSTASSSTQAAGTESTGSPRGHSTPTSGAANTPAGSALHPLEDGLFPGRNRLKKPDRQTRRERAITPRQKYAHRFGRGIARGALHEKRALRDTANSRRETSIWPRVRGSASSTILRTTVLRCFVNSRGLALAASAFLRRTSSQSGESTNYAAICDGRGTARPRTPAPVSRNNTHRGGTQEAEPCAASSCQHPGLGIDIGHVDLVVRWPTSLDLRAAT